MQSTEIPIRRGTTPDVTVTGGPFGDTSGVSISWRAIIAGAVGAAAFTLLLVLLGLGLGLSAMSPWADSGASAEALGMSSAAWLAVTQILAAVLGGYLAGRMRPKWTNLQDSETRFRDLAHGFLSWSLSTLLTAILISSTVAAILGSGARFGAAAVQGMASGAASRMVSGVGMDGEGGPVGYFVDALLRTEAATGDAGDRNVRAEVTSILLNSVRSGGDLSADDARYLGVLVARRTGMSQAEADKRVADVYARARKAYADAQVGARQAADTARKAGAQSAIWTFVGLLLGAIAAALAATWGGRRRDQV